MKKKKNARKCVELNSSIPRLFREMDDRYPVVEPVIMTIPRVPCGIEGRYLEDPETVKRQPIR